MKSGDRKHLPLDKRWRHLRVMYSIKVHGSLSLVGN